MSLKDRKRLQWLEDMGQAYSESSHRVDEIEVALLSSRLGRAGFMSLLDRRRARFWITLCGSVCWVFAVCFGYFSAGLIGSVYGTLIWLVIVPYVCAGYFRWREIRFYREVLFRLPLTLEALILAVDSGLSVFAAIEKLISSEEISNSANPVVRLFRVLYQQCASGAPIEHALQRLAESVPHSSLQHTLLHLDISMREGAELIPSLRNLSEYAHLEWRTSVEARVKKLENAVVFPVFLSVIGLMLLVAAVPIVPILELTRTIAVEKVSL